VKTISITFLMILFLSSKIYCNELKPRAPYTMDGITTGLRYVFSEKNPGLNIDANLFYLCFSLGYNYEIRNSYKPEHKLFTGIGLSNLIELQLGTNFEYLIIRVRSDLHVFKGNIFWDDARENWYSRINLQLFIDIEQNTTKSFLFGVGVGYLL
jgi:hypothetical protein